MIDFLDRLPKDGEVVTLEDGTVLTAIKVSRNRIQMVRIELPEKESKDEE